MKNFKKIVLLSAFALFAVLSFGFKAKAASTELLCIPESLKDDSTVSKCYLISRNIGEEAAGGPYYSYAANVVLTDLVFDGNNPFEVPSGSTIAAEAAGTGTQFAHLPNVTCQPQSISSTLAGKGIKTDKEMCANFYSKEDGAQHINKGGLPLYNNDKVKPANPGDKYYTIGIIRVKKNPNVTADKTCGYICVFGRGYTSKDSSAVEVTNGTGDWPCKEITITKTVASEEQGNPATGNITSYAILAAGAFIAICAVLVAKKNNRFYKV